MKIKVSVDLKELFKINRVVKFLILSDLIFLSGWEMIDPIFALFVVNDVIGATIITVGATVSVYWFTKSLAQIPIAIYLDKHKGERDDFRALVFSLMLSGFASFALVLVKTTPTLFLVLFLKALAFAFYIPSWSAIFSRHLDKKHYAFDWSLDSATIGIASGVAAFAGGAIAGVFGFQAVFIFSSALSFASMMLLLMAPSLILPKPISERSIGRDHTPAGIGK